MRAVRDRHVTGQRLKPLADTCCQCNVQPECYDRSRQVNVMPVFFCNIRYTSEAHLKLGFHENLFVRPEHPHQWFNRFKNVHRSQECYCRALCKKKYNLITEQYNLGERDFTIFQFKMCRTDIQYCNSPLLLFYNTYGQWGWEREWERSR